MDSLASVLFLAGLNWSVVEYLKAPVKDQPWFATYGWLTMYVSFATDLALGFVSGVNVLPDLVPALTDPLIGRVLTSILIGGGASLIHDVVDRK